MRREPPRSGPCFCPPGGYPGACKPQDVPSPSSLWLGSNPCGSEGQRHSGHTWDGGAAGLVLGKVSSSVASPAPRRVPEACCGGTPPPRARRSCTPPKCAGTRGSGRRCPAKGLRAAGAWILRGDVHTRGLWFRLVPLCLDATLVPAPSSPALPAPASLSALSCPVLVACRSPQARPPGATRAWHGPSVQAQARHWPGPLLVALLADVVTASINPVVVAGTRGSLCWLVLRTPCHLGHIP